MKKVLKYFIILSFILIPLNIKAETCTYQVDVSYADGDVKLSCHANYTDALNAMNNYPSTDKNVAVIKKNNMIINAKYAIAKIDVVNNGELGCKTDGVKNLYKTSLAARNQSAQPGSPDFLTYIATTWGADAAFLNYDPTYDTVNIKISGATGWLRKSDANIIPISKFYGATFNYQSNRPKIKAIKDGITLRSDHSTSASKVGTYTANTNQEFYYYPSKTYDDGTYLWYKVQYNSQTQGWLASKKNDPYMVDTSILLNDTYYYSRDNILYHRIHKGSCQYEVDMTLGTAPYVYNQPKVKSFYLANSSGTGSNANIRYYGFDSNYFYDSFSKMIDDYRNNNYNQAINSKTPYFAYFMYLPSRSLTGYTANSFNQMVINKGYTSFPINPKSYINPQTGSFKPGMSAGKSSMMFGIGDAIIEAQNTYGANAMGIYSNAVRESATGTSAIAFYKNNLFGMNAVDSDPFNKAFTYNTVRDSVMDYAQKLSYANAYADLYDYRYNGTHEGNKLSGTRVQYASDPYAGESSTGTAFWSDFNNGKIDEFKNTLGIKISNNLVNIYSEPSTSSRIIYQTKNYKTGNTLVNVPLIVTDYVEVNNQGFYRVYTDANLNSNRVYDKNSYYNFNNCYGYVRKEDLYVQNHQPVINATDVHISQFEEFKSKATAEDYENGDITKKIKTTGEVDSSTPGTYKITYTVYDNENFKAEKTINVIVDASDKPIITLNDKTVTQYTKYDALDEVTATDKTDGNLTEKIIITSGELNMDEVGTYKITYEVKDNDDNVTTASRTITVIPNEVPVITATNKTAYLNQPFNALANVTAYDKEDGDLTSSITYTGEVVTDKTGTFTITYSVTDSAKNKTTKTITVTVEEKKFIAKENIFQLENLSYNKDTKKLDILGFLIIKGMNNLVSTNITYDIIFENQFDGNETIMPLSRLLKDMPYQAPANSGFTNTGSWFKESLDLSTLGNGDYTVYIRARSGDFETKSILRNPFLNEKFVKKFESNGTGYLFKSNYYNKSIPLELSVRKEGLISNVNNPTIDNMYNQVYDISLSDDKLNIQASSHNVKGNYANDQNVIREIYLENIKTKKIAKKYDVGSITNGPYVISLKVSDGYSKTRAWYKTSLDLKDLDVGTYSIIVRTKTGNIDDYGELYDVLFKEIAQNSTSGNRKYSISRNNNIRYRIELKIEE